jgi:hypothetical protein
MGSICVECNSRKARGLRGDDRPRLSAQRNPSSPRDRLQPTRPLDMASDSIMVRYLARRAATVLRASGT